MIRRRSAKQTAPGPLHRSPQGTGTGDDDDDSAHPLLRGSGRRTRGTTGSSSSSTLIESVKRVLMRGIFDDSDAEDASAETSSEERGAFLNRPHTSEDVLAAEGEAADFVHLPYLYPHNQDDAERKKTHAARRQLSGKVAGDQCLGSKPTPFYLKPVAWFTDVRESLAGDFGSIGLLLFLYLLQGVPLGIISAIPLILQGHNVSYKQQAVFSFAHWPFSLKLLWAPIVDSLYFRAIGRRKSWMVPCQYLIGVGFLFISYYSPMILGTDESSQGKSPDVTMLMLIFLPLNFLAATQDIAVDGWALTMLSRKNVGYASTCNVVGQTIGFFLGNVALLTLESKDFANKWFRNEPKPYGLVDLPTFTFFWAWVFIGSTTLVLIFKREIDHSLQPDPNSVVSSDEKHNATELQGLNHGAAEPAPQGLSYEDDLGVLDTYKILVKILRLKPVMYMIAVLLTAKIAFAATDGMTDLKLITMGVKKDGIASRAIFLTPLQIVLPWLLSKQTTGRRPLSVFLWAYPYRVFMDIVFAVLTFYTPNFQLDNGEYPYSYYVIWIVVYYFHQISAYCIFLSMMAFNAQVSDPVIGGTYMTLLNTLNNLGGNWPVTLVLSVTDFFTFKNCVAKGTSIVLSTCNKKAEADLCAAGGDVCEMAIDGYYISVGICTLFGAIWYKFFYKRIQYFQRIPREEWRIVKTVAAKDAKP